MNHSITPREEQALFETALADPDQLLRESLLFDERQRRRRRWMFVSLLIGGIAMFTTVMAVLAGWLTLAAPPPVESPPAAQSSVAKAETADAWVERLKGLRDHMHTAFGVGPDLTLLDPDQGVEIVRQAWPQLKEPDVKTGLLKTFAFSKALPNKHPKLFQVLDLGMNDSDPKIRAYAASYVSEYSGLDFTDDLPAYKAWYKKFGDKTPEEVLEIGTSGAASKSKTESKSNAVIDKGEQTEKLTDRLSAKGWQQFFGRDYRSAEATFREILAKDSEHLAAMNGLGFALLNQGKPKKARPHFERILALEPNSPGPLNGLARCLRDEGDLDGAIKIWERALKISPGPNDCSYSLGLAYVQKGQMSKAIPLLEMSQKANSDDPKIKQALEKARAANK
jgi:Flp pilus assembly protein TadD